MPWKWSPSVGPTINGREIDLIGGVGVAFTNARTLHTTSDHLAVLVDHDLPAPTKPQEAPVATSQNGYTANDRSRIKSFTIPGTTRNVSLRFGAPGEMLCHFAAWFDKNIESVDGGILDDWGYAERPIRGSSTTLSNHASGTAIDLNAPRHPLGKRNTFSAEQTRKIRAQLKVYEGAIRWGGDYKNRADEMHFEIMASPEECEEIMARLNATPTRPAPPTEKPNHPLNYVTAMLKTHDTYAPRIDKGRKAAVLAAKAIRAALVAFKKRFA